MSASKPDRGTLSLVPDKASSPFKQSLAVLYFMASSTLTQAATKSLFTVFGFNFPVTLCLFQMAFSALVCAAVGRATFDWHALVSMIPLALVNCANTLSGLFGTGGLSVPMFIVLRRFTMLLTIALEYFAFHKRHDWQVLASISVMVSGALIAAMSDLSFNFAGYAAVILNDFFTAGYLVMLKNYEAAKNMDSTTILLYNAIISVVPLLAASWALGDVQSIRAFDWGASVPLQLTAAAAVCLGVTINHSTYVCTRVNEPLTTSVAGSFKNILMTGIGMLAFFGDYVYDSVNMLGIGVSMAGAVWYAYYGARKAMSK